MKTASVTTMKNKLSAQLKKVKAGERLLITDRQQPIAVLEPLSGVYAEKRIEGLMAEGIIDPPSQSLNLKKLLSTPRAKTSQALTQAIIEEREER